MVATLADSRSSNGLFISAAAKKYGVCRSALNRRLNLKTASTAQYHDSKRLLNNAQEKELLKSQKTLRTLFATCAKNSANVA